LDFFDNKIFGDHKRRIIKKDFDEISDTSEDESLLADSRKRRNFLPLYALALVVFAILFYKLWSLQIAQGGYFRFLSEGNRIRNKIITASRGVIYSKDGQLLVSNTPSFVLEVTPQD